MIRRVVQDYNLLFLLQVVKVICQEFKLAFGNAPKDLTPTQRQAYDAAAAAYSDLPWYKVSGINCSRESVDTLELQDTTVDIIRMDVTMSDSETTLKDFSTTRFAKVDPMTAFYNGVVIDPPEASKNSAAYWSDQMLGDTLKMLTRCGLLAAHTVAIFLPDRSRVDDILLILKDDCGYDRHSVIDLFETMPPNSSRSPAFLKNTPSTILVVSKGININPFEEDPPFRPLVRFFPLAVRSDGHPGPRGRPEITNLYLDSFGRPVSKHQKPVDAVRWLLRQYFPQPLSLISVCAGSGTDAIAACEEAATKVLCLEKDPATFAGMHERLKAYRDGQAAKYAHYSNPPGEDIPPEVAAYTDVLQTDAGLSAEPSTADVSRILALLVATYTKLLSPKKEVVAIWAKLTEMTLGSMSALALKNMDASDLGAIQYVAARPSLDLAFKSFRRAKRWPVPEGVKFSDLGPDWENHWMMRSSTEESAT
jgi:hypothetical protein